MAAALAFEIELCEISSLSLLAAVDYAADSGPEGLVCGGGFGN